MLPCLSSFRHALATTPVDREASWRLGRPPVTAFSEKVADRLPRRFFRGLLGVHSHSGLPARQVAETTLCTRDSDGFVTESRRSDCYRPELPSSPGGMRTRWSDIAFARRAVYLLYACCTALRILYSIQQNDKFLQMESTVAGKVVALLELLGRCEADSPLGQITQQLGLPKPSVHRMLQTMARLGYVAKTERGAYCLTSKIDSIRHPECDRRVLELADPSLVELHRATSENVNLGVLRRDGVTYLRVFQSTFPLRRVAEVNSADPAHCTALGRSILAHLAASERSALLRRTAPFVKRTPHTVTDPAKIERLLDEVRRRGFAVERDETDIGIACYGAPILRGSTVCAAVSLSVPSARCDAKRERRLITMVRQSAKQISKLLSRTELAHAAS